MYKSFYYFTSIIIHTFREGDSSIFYIYDKTFGFRRVSLRIVCPEIICHGVRYSVKRSTENWSTQNGEGGKRSTKIGKNVHRR
jgi:hypothetical protein